MITINLISLFLLISIITYTLLGGADFGMGILELLFKKNKASRGKLEKLTKTAMGPVREANQVWIIIIVVILFVAFPKAFSKLCIELHVPLFLMLIGIVIRGSAFSFRHYDPIRGRTHQIHTFFFNASSCLTPLFLGMIAASLITPFPANATSYMARYIWPWITPFTLSAGLLFVSLSGLTAATFCLFEKEAEQVYPYLKKIHHRLWWATAILGVTTLLIGQFRFWLLSQYLKDPLLNLLLCGTLLMVVINKLAIPRKEALFAYLSIGGIVTGITSGFFLWRFPVLIQIGDQQWTVYNSAAPTLTIQILNITLIIGLLIIIPLLIYLLKVFKKSEL